MADQFESDNSQQKARLPQAKKLESSAGNATTRPPLPGQPTTTPSVSPITSSKASPAWVLPATLLGSGMALALMIVVVFFATRDSGPQEQPSIVAESQPESKRTKTQLRQPPTKNKPVAKEKESTPSTHNKSDVTPQIRVETQPAPVNDSPFEEISATKPNSPFAIRIEPRAFIELARSKGIIERSRPFTVEYWVRFKAEMLFTLVGDRTMGGQHPAVEKGSERGWNMAVFPNNEGTPVLAVQKGGPGFHKAKDFQWVHIALSSDGTSWKLFENGRQRAEREDSWQPSPSNIFIGDGPHCRRPRLVETSSVIDIAAFRVSSKQRYADDFDVPGSFKVDADTVVLLDFSRPSPDRIEDLSGNNHAGAITAAKWIDLANDREVSLSN